MSAGISLSNEGDKKGEGASQKGCLTGLLVGTFLLVGGGIYVFLSGCQSCQTAFMYLAVPFGLILLYCFYDYFKTARSGVNSSETEEQ